MRIGKTPFSVKKPVANFLIVLLSTSVMLLLVELTPRMVGYPNTLTSGWRGYEYLKPNQLGFRGQQINYSAKDFVIVLLGDSQIEADACSLDSMPERRLQYYLNQSPEVKRNVKVFSVGAAGYGQDQQLLILREYFRHYRADMVLLWFTPRNDIWNNIFPTHWPKNGHPKPTFRIIDNNLSGPNSEFGKSVFKERLKILELAHRAVIKIGLKDRPDQINDDFWEKSLPPPYQPLNVYKGPVCYDWQNSWDKGKITDENLENEKSHMAIHLTPRSERMQYGIDLTAKLLNEISKLVKKRQAAFAIFYAQAPKGNDECPYDPAVYKLNGKYYKTSVKQYKDNLASIMGDHTYFPIPITIRDWKVGRYNVHLNKIANDQVIRDLSKSLRPLLIDSLL